jgi:hypothetical protein
MKPQRNRAVMSIYSIVRITGGIGYKVHVTYAASGLRVIGVFPTEADAMHWIATDQEPRPSLQRSEHAGVTLADRS